MDPKEAFPEVIPRLPSNFNPKKLFFASPTEEHKMEGDENGCSGKCSWEERDDASSMSSAAEEMQISEGEREEASER